MRPHALPRTARAAGAIALAVLMTGCGSTSPTGSATRSPQTNQPSLAPISPTPTPVAGGILVETTADLGAISPYVYGTNFVQSFPYNETQKVGAEQAKLRFVSYPGGDWGDLNDITPQQIDDFIAVAKDLGAEPRIVVRLKGGSPEKAAALVTYANRTKGYNVRYWGIGNEPDLYAANAQNGGSDERYKTYDPKTYAAEWRTFAEAMRKVDPSIKLVGPDVSQFTGDPAADPYTQVRANWLKEFLKTDGDLVDVVSIHRYPFGDPEPTVAGLRDNSKEWDQIIPSLRQLIRTQTGRDLPVAVTEVNSSWNHNVGGDASLDSHYNAIWFGDVLGRMIRERVDIVCQFALTGDYAIVGKYDPYPLWNVYMLYQHFGTKFLRATSDDPLVSVFAAKRADGTVTVMLVNLGDSAAQKKLEIVGVSATSADTWQFTKDHPAGEITATPLAGEIQLPPQSMTLLLVPKQ